MRAGIGGPRTSREVLVGERTLPDPALDDAWQRIFLPSSQKAQLLGHAVFALSLRSKLSVVGSALHGLLVLVGPPGTGKTTIARGLANEAAKVLQRQLGSTQYAEINPHALPSELLGRTQRAVVSLLEEEIPSFASHEGPTIILLDEVETLAVSRVRASLETNPVDVHRATDAVLSGLDRLAERFPSLVFIGTSNWKGGLDEAFLSRADEVFHIGLPDEELAARILEDTLQEYAKAWPEMAALTDPDFVTKLARECCGLDGRRLRKLVTSALALDIETAADPGKLTKEAMLQAARVARSAIEA